MVNASNIIILIVLLAGFLSLVMFLTRHALVCAMSLLGVLLCTAVLFAMMGEHFVAAVQLVVYAGAIMVLFIFSIMLLNIRKEVGDFKITSPSFILGFAGGCTILMFGYSAIVEHFKIPSDSLINNGSFGVSKIRELGGNTQVLSHALFTNYYISFEVISLALLVAIIGTVVLAKRKLT